MSKGTSDMGRSSGNGAGRRVRSAKSQSWLTPELLSDLVRVSDPQISPDGSRVAYVVTPVSKREEHPTSEIWIVSARGGDERRLTFGKGQDAAPRWSPDGQQIAFTSDRTEPESPQLYVMPTYGGEAVQVTRRATAISNPQWSPNGRFIAFLSKDEATEEEEAAKKARRDQVVDGANLKRTRLYLVEPNVAGPRQISPAGKSHIWSFCWAPDSASIAAARTRSPLIRDQRLPNDILILNVTGKGRKKSRTLVRFPSRIERPQWSSDGASLAVLASGGQVRAADQIHVVDVAGGDYRRVPPEYPGSVSRIAWNGRGKLLFSSVENVHGAINRLDTTSGEWESVLNKSDHARRDFDDGLSLDAGGAFVITCSDSTHPGQVFLWQEGARLRCLTSANKRFNTGNFPKSSVTSWAAPDGLEIFGLQILPAKGKRPYPTVLIVHGGPASAFTDRFSAGWHDWGPLFAAHGFAVLMPNPRGSIGRGAGFTDANVGDLGGMELQDSLAGIDHLVEAGIADPDRLAVAGWSHGGYMTAWSITQTNRFKAAIMGAGVSNLISDHGTNDIPGFNLDYFFDSYRDLYRRPELLWERSPLRLVSSVRTPTLLLHGDGDERVAASQAREFHRALNSLGVPTELVIYPRETHRIAEREHQIDLQNRLTNWLERWV